MEGIGGNEEADSNLVGETIARRWRVVRFLGQGGMGSVYEARQDDGTRVALKLLRPVLARNPRTRARFLREGRIAQAIGHPNAVRVLDSVCERDGRLFLIMELLDGETLGKRRVEAGGRLGQHEVLRVATQVLEVLASAHAKAIFHRDIKPENIFVTRDGAAKILDFGIAAIRDEALDDAQITQSGISLGTPAFMAPEQARGRHSHVDARTDIWAVGATMFFCLSGRHVHGDAATANEALIFSATQPAPPLRSLCPEVPAAIARVVDRALALDRLQRWESADAMRDALTSATMPADGSAPELLDIPGGDATKDDAPSAAGPRVEAHKRRRWPLAALLVAGALVAGALARGASSDPAAGASKAAGAVTTVPPAAGSAFAAPEIVRPPPPTAAVEGAVLPEPAPTAAKQAKAVLAAPDASALSHRIPDSVLDRRK